MGKREEVEILEVPICPDPFPKENETLHVGPPYAGHKYSLSRFQCCSHYTLWLQVWQREAQAPKCKNIISCIQLDKEVTHSFSRETSVAGWTMPGTWGSIRKAGS